MALTQQQINELNIASQRIASGSGSATDLANVNYAKNTYGYKYQAPAPVPSNPSAVSITPIASGTQSGTYTPYTQTQTQPVAQQPVVQSQPMTSIPYASNITSQQQAGINNLISSNRVFNETDARNFAYSIGRPNDYQKYIGQTGSQIVSGLGSIGSVPKPGSPIPVSSLTAGQKSLQDILGANFDTSNIDSNIAGLLGAYGAQSKDLTAVKGYQTKLTDLMSSLGAESADLKAEMEKQGVLANYEKVKELNIKAAQLQGQLSTFDANTLQGAANLENQAIPTGLILGQQAQYKKQQDLSRIALAAELSGTIALSQAYQGNATLGLELAKNAVDMKYQPILNQIDVVKTQLGFAIDNMNASDAKRAKVIDYLLTQRQNEINREVDTKKQIESMAIQAAYNGAPTSLIAQMRALTDPVQAAQLGASFLKGNLESVNGSNVTGISNPQDVIEGFDLGSYATDPTHEQQIRNIMSQMGKITSTSQIDSYIKSKAPNSSITPQMITSASQKYGVSWELLMAIMQQESNFGTSGVGARTYNPGNIGNVDSGGTTNYGSWDKGVDAIGAWLSNHKANTGSNNLTVQAILAQPALYDTLTPTQRGALLPSLIASGFQYQGKPLSPEAAKVRVNAQSGLDALTKIESEINKDKSVLLRAAVPGGVLARDFWKARREVSDVITRLRTGAALNESEEKFYIAQLPGALDYFSPASITESINRLRTLFSSLVSTQTQYGNQTSSSNLTSGSTSSGLTYTITP